MYLPASIPNVPEPQWLGLWTPAYGPPFYGSPPIGFAIRGGSLILGLNQYARVKWAVVWSIPIPRDRWMRYTVNFDFAQSGWIKLWVNGRAQWLREGNAPRVRRLSVRLIDPINVVGPNSPRIMVYYLLNAFPKITAYFADFRMGSTRAQVLPPDAGAPDS
jgi:hypothetical protein